MFWVKIDRKVQIRMGYAWLRPENDSDIASNYRNLLSYAWYNKAKIY